MQKSNEVSASNVLIVDFGKQNSEFNTTLFNNSKMKQSTLRDDQDRMKQNKMACGNPLRKLKIELMLQAVRNCLRAEQEVNGNGNKTPKPARSLRGIVQDVMKRFISPGGIHTDKETFESGIVTCENERSGEL